MRKVFILLALVAIFFGVKEFLSSIEKPVSGPVEVIVVSEETETVTVGPVTVTVSEVTTKTTEEVEEVAEPVFMPLMWDGKKIKKFAKKHGVKVMKLDNTYGRALINMGLAKENLPLMVVKVSGDLYFKAKDGTVYVAHTGKLIKLN